MTRFLDFDPVVIDAAWLSPQRWTGFLGGQHFRFEKKGGR
jgi:hypothetical protein